MFKKIVVAYDHRVQKKYIDKIAEVLGARGVEMLLIEDSDSANDYPLLVERAMKRMWQSKADGLILLCGSGTGMNIVANKYDGIRSALPFGEAEAFYARRHENINCICFGTGVKYDAEDLPEIKPICRRKMARMIDIFLNTEFEGERHERRISQIAEIEKNN